MKKTILFFASLCVGLLSAEAQVLIDRQVQMNGAAANDRVVTGLSFPSTRPLASLSGQDAVSYETYQSNYLSFNSATGAGNAFNVNLRPAIAAYSQGMMVTFLSNQTITGPATLNVNGQGALSIRKNGNATTLAAGDIVDLQMVTVVHDGTNWQLLNETPSGSVTIPDAWLLAGNGGTDPNNDFLGTTDAQPLVIRTNNNERMRVLANGQVGVNTATPFANSVFQSNAAGTNDAIVGSATGAERAVYGQNTGGGEGIYGLVNANGGIGARGLVLAPADNTSMGMLAQNNGLGMGMLIDINNAANAENALFVQTNGTGRVAEFQQNNATSTDPAVLIFNAGEGRGLNVQQNNAAATENTLFASHAGDGRVINAQNTLTTSTEQVGFFAQNSTGTNAVTFGDAASVWGQSDGIRSGVFLASANSSNTIALSGQFLGTGNNDGIGVFGFAGNANPGWGIGMLGEGDFWAVFGNGDTGAAGVKAFTIDHPLDPENKFLKHYSMESPEVLNTYRGNVTLDANGEATITLPTYFETINRNVSYQLTPIGAAAPGLFVKEEVSNGRFTISGGTPGMKVSWNLYAERNDAYLQQNPSSREVEPAKKPHQRGLYLMPELFGQPEEKGIFYKNKQTGGMKPNATPQTPSQRTAPAADEPLEAEDGE